MPGSGSWSEFHYYHYTSTILYIITGSNTNDGPTIPPACLIPPGTPEGRCVGLFGKNEPEPPALPVASLTLVVFVRHIVLLNLNGVHKLFKIRGEVKGSCGDSAGYLRQLAQDLLALFVSFEAFGDCGGGKSPQGENSHVGHRAIP